MSNRSKSPIVVLAALVLALSALALPASLQAAPSKPTVSVAATADRCAEPMARLKETYQRVEPVRVRAFRVDTLRRVVELDVEGVARPVAVPYSETVHMPSVEAYAAYLRDRIGHAAFDRWAGTNDASSPAEIADHMVDAQRAWVERIAARAIAGEIRLVMHDQASRWSAAAGADDLLLTAFETSAVGCVSSPVGEPVRRADASRIQSASVAGSGNP